MINDADNLSRSISQHDGDTPSILLRDQRLQQYSSSCSSLTSGIGQSDQSICNDRAGAADNSDAIIDRSTSVPSVISKIDLNSIDQRLRRDIKKFVDNIFIDSQSISLEKKAEFGQLVRSPEARLLFAMFVDDYRVNSKKVSELTFYSLAQYFSIVLFECLVAEDFRPAKIIMNMMFTYYHEQSGTTNSARGSSKNSCDEDQVLSTNKTYLYTLLKDQQIFKSIRFWTSAFYESVVIERNNHPVFINRDQYELTNERRDEESDCSKNITFGLLGSFIHNMSLLDLSQEFCQEFLDKHSTIAGLQDDQMEMLRSSMKNMFNDTSSTPSAPITSTSEKFATFLHKLSTKLNSSQANQPDQNPK